MEKHIVDRLAELEERVAKLEGKPQGKRDDKATTKLESEWNPPQDR
jgi:hypothetical protein